MSARRLAALTMIAVGAMTSAACSISSSGQTLTIGAAVPLTGSLYKEGAATQEGYQLCVDKVNSAGGVQIGSRTVKLQVKFADDASTPVTAARLVDQFNAQGIKLIFGSYGSANTMAEVARTEKNGQILMDSAGADNGIFLHGYKRIFAVLSPASDYAASIVEAIDDLAKPTPRTIAFLSADDSFSKTATASGEVAARALGMTVLGEAFFPSGATDVRAAIDKIKALKPDVVIGSVHLAEGVAIVRQSRQAGLTPVAVGETVAPPSGEFTKTLGAQAEGVLGSSQWTRTAGGSDDIFGNATAYDQAVQAAYHHAADYHDAEASAACVALVLALRSARSDDPATVAQALANLDTMSFFGPLHFDSTGKNVSKEMVVIQIQKGVPVTVWPPGASEAHLVWPAA
jgi:branched-chain amino acid transport system substrate-binding protein